MTTNLKVILSAAGVAALLASPAMAKTVVSTCRASTVFAKQRAGFVGPYGYGAGEGGPTRRARRRGPNRDFRTAAAVDLKLHPFAGRRSPGEYFRATTPYGSSPSPAHRRGCAALSAAAGSARCSRIRNRPYGLTPHPAAATFAVGNAVAVVRRIALLDGRGVVVGRGLGPLRG